MRWPKMTPQMLSWGRLGIPSCLWPLPSPTSECLPPPLCPPPPPQTHPKSQPCLLPPLHRPRSWPPFLTPADSSISLFGISSFQIVGNWDHISSWIPCWAGCSEILACASPSGLCHLTALLHSAAVCHPVTLRPEEETDSFLRTDQSLCPGTSRVPSPGTSVTQVSASAPSN